MRTWRLTESKDPGFRIIWKGYERNKKDRAYRNACYGDISPGDVIYVAYSRF